MIEASDQECSISYKKYPTKKRRYPYKRIMKRKLRKIAFMAIAVAVATGVNYYNKHYSSTSKSQQRTHYQQTQQTSDAWSGLKTDVKTLQKLRRARQNPRATFWVTVHGRVIKRLRDDLSGSRHQKFLIKIDDDFTLLVSHNIDLAPRIPLSKGSLVSISGLYEWNSRGGVIHWTHRDPKGRKKGGWIQLGDKRYQ